MICAFLGEHKTPENLFGVMEWFITSLAMNPSIHKFYVGNHTAFEKMVLLVLREIKRKYATIQYTVIMTPADVSYIDEKESAYLLTPDIPEGVEIEDLSKEMRKTIITQRNEWLVENADMIIYSDYLENGKEDWIEAYTKEHEKVCMNIAYDEYFV